MQNKIYKQLWDNGILKTEQEIQSLNDSKFNSINAKIQDSQNSNVRISQCS